MGGGDHAGEKRLEKAVSGEDREGKTAGQKVTL